MARATHRSIRDEKFEANTRLIHFALKQFSTSPDTYDDLYQVGSMGLLHAIDRFDETKGFQFSTYAINCIRGYVMSYLTEKNSLVHLPDAKVKLRNTVGPTIESLQHRLHREPARKEVAKELGIELAALDRINTRMVTSSVEDDFPESSTHALDPTDAEDLDHLRYLLDALDPIERLIAVGLSRGETQTRIAEDLGLNQTTVGRIIRDKIRAKLAGVAM